MFSDDTIQSWMTNASRCRLSRPPKRPMIVLSYSRQMAYVGMTVTAFASSGFDKVFGINRLEAGCQHGSLGLCQI